jgi:hypothetical protein
MSCLSGHVRVSEDGLPWETVRPATPRTFFKKLFCPGFTLPQQETADVVIEKDRPHQFANVPWFPFKLSLKIRDNKTAIA